MPITFPTLNKNLLKVFNITTGGVQQLFQRVGGMSNAKSIVVWLRQTASVNAPSAVVTLRPIRPEAPSPALAADKGAAFAATLTQVNDGLQRQEFGLIANETLGDDMEFDLNRTIATSTADTEVWVEIIR